MAWATPQYEHKLVNSAGRQIAEMDFPLVGEDAIQIINNWRSSHSYPLNTFQNTLRNRAKKIEKEIIVAQRIKRLESIHAKLKRQKTMKMTQMQDIAGCRIVFKDLSSVRNLVQKYKETRFDHKLRGEKNYIDNPKSDGYRCHHLVFEYSGSVSTEPYNGLKIEIQVRTQMQHAWATAVEAVGIFTKQALKSNQGDLDWLRFFALMSSAIALHEGCSPVPNTPSDIAQLTSEIRDLVTRLRVTEFLVAYNITLKSLGDAKDAKYFLLTLDLDEGNMSMKRFKASQSQDANKEYTKAESSVKSNAATQIVLVSVESVAALRRAYPNYFLDTNIFRKIVAEVLHGKFLRGPNMDGLQKSSATHP